MNPILYDISEKKFTSHGLGGLECMSCFVEEERNGSYELEMKAALQGSHVADLSVGRIILAKPNRTDQPQPFRIYNLVKSLDQTIQVYARHISYDLSGRILSNISSSSCGATLSALASDPSLNNEWTFTTDRSAVSGNFSSEVPGSCRSWLGGRRGSVLDLYGPADWHFDRYTCEFLTSRGADRGVTIRYGKNLLAMKAAVDSSNVYSGVLCYYDSDGVVVKGTEVATGQTALQRTLLIDKTGDYTEAVPTSTQLTDDATAYVSSHNLTAPASNITLDWVQSGEIIDRIDLCDTVSVVYDDFGVSAKAKCIRTKWNVLEERYEEIEIGEVRTTLADTIASTNEQIQEAQQEMETGYMAAIRAASALITGAAGGYVVLWNSSIMAPADETHPANEILIMNDPDVNSATKVWRWNIDGLGYSNNGYAGPFQTAIDMNGGIATWFIDTVRINADNITAGTLTGRIINNGTGTFYVDANGNLTAQAGIIGGWKISPRLLDKTTQYVSGTPADVYRAFISAPENPTAGHLAFGLEKLDYDGSALSHNSYMFYVGYDGKLYAKAADIEGKIKATSGEISGDLTLSGSLKGTNSFGKVSFNQDGLKFLTSGATFKGGIGPYQIPGGGFGVNMIGTDGAVVQSTNGQVAVEGQTNAILNAKTADAQIYGKTGAEVFVENSNGAFYVLIGGVNSNTYFYVDNGGAGMVINGSAVWHS